MVETITAVVQGSSLEMTCSYDLDVPLCYERWD